MSAFLPVCRDTAFKACPTQHGALHLPSMGRGEEGFPEKIGYKLFPAGGKPFPAGAVSGAGDVTLFGLLLLYLGEAV